MPYTALKRTCPECYTKLRELAQVCAGCGYKIELVTKDEDVERFIRRPSVGGLLWTQAYAFGSRQYIWFVLSILPLTGLIALPAMFLFGRRWSWHKGGWESFEEYKRRQILLDRIGTAWVLLLMVMIFYVRNRP